MKKITSFVKARYHSGKNQFWTTPKWLYEELEHEFNFDFDPAPIDPTFDGLIVEWGSCNYINPPYNDISSWLEKARLEQFKGKTSVFLLPVRTDTRWFHNYIYHIADEIRFIKGRLKFGEAKNSSPFPSMIIVFRGR